jgi:hypothetical protein
MRSLLYLEGQVRNRMEASAKRPGETADACARVVDRIELYDPCGDEALGIGFLEFAVDEASARWER